MKHYLRICSGLIALLAIALVCRAAETPKLPAPQPDHEWGSAALPGLPPARHVIAPGDPTIFAIKPHTGYEKTALLAVVPAEGQSFSNVLQLTAGVRSEQPFMIQATTMTTSHIDLGDTLMCSMMVRCTQPLPDKDYGKVNVTLQMAGAPWDGYGQNVRVEKDWQRVVMPFSFKSKAAIKTLAAGQAQMVIGYGYGPQTVELADIQLVDFGKTVGPEQLPAPPVTYAGREEGAAWRTAALERIDQIRKGDLAVTVTDAAGNPVPDASVHVEMLKHAFKWGTAVSGERIRRMTDADSDRYRTEIPALFNTIVFESDLKWIVWDDPKVKQDAAFTMDWADKLGLAIRGHCLVWPSWRKNNPALQARYAKDPAGLAKAIDDHIADIGDATKGRIYEWDVTNETRTSNDWIKMLGDKLLVHSFVAAKAVAPNSRLVANENNILECSNEFPSDEQEGFSSYIKMLVDQGAPVQAIGFQSHFAKGRLTDPEVILKVLDSYQQQFHLPIAITEYDFDVPDTKLQGDFTRDFLIACFSHPDIDEFLMWGFWDGQHYAKNAPIYNKDWSLKPSGQAYKDLVLNRWWTRESGNTQAEGKYSTRGFLGDYEITVEKGDKKVSVRSSIAKNGRTLTVVLK